MSNSKSISSERSVRVFKIKKKIEGFDPEQEIEHDFLLEKGGDARNYLNPSVPYNLGPRFDNGKIVPHSVIGPSSLFLAKTIDSRARSPIKKFSQGSYTRRLTIRNNAIGEKSEHVLKFNEVMRRINMAREKSAFEERERLQKLSNREKKIEKKQLISVSPIEKQGIKFEIMNPKQKLNKKSNSEGLLRLNSVKKGENEKDSQYTNTNNLIWYMSLRETQNSEHLNAFLRVGNALDGLYTKIKRPNPIYKPSKMASLPKIDPAKNIEVVGINKLNSEIDAVKKIGYEFLRPELLDITDKESEELIEENYDERIFFNL